MNKSKNNRTMQHVHYVAKNHISSFFSPQYANIEKKYSQPPPIRQSFQYANFLCSFFYGFLICTQYFYNASGQFVVFMHFLLTCSGEWTRNAPRTKNMFAISLWQFNCVSVNLHTFIVVQFLPLSFSQAFAFFMICFHILMGRKNTSSFDWLSVQIGYWLGMKWRGFVNLGNTIALSAFERALFAYLINGYS